MVKLNLQVLCSGLT